MSKVADLTSTGGSVKESREQLVKDLKRVIEDAQNLAEEAKNASGAAVQDKIRTVQDELEKKMKVVRECSSDFLAEASKQTEAVEDNIRQHPWRAVAIAVGVGILIDRLFR